MRINLYQTLSGVNNFFQSALSSSVGTLQEQTVAIGIVENELNQAKKRLELLEAEKNNKVRLVEINDYYSDRYAEHSQLMKIVILTLVPVIILTVLFTRSIIPSFIYYALLVIVCIIGGYYFWTIYFSMITRDNMNYQEYSWYFNAANAPTGAASSTDPWAGLGMGTCIGQQCCSTGQVWDASINQCIGDSTVTETFEGMIQKSLTKTQNGKYKSDYVIGNQSHYQAPMSKSFINNSGIK